MQTLKWHIMIVFEIKLCVKNYSQLGLDAVMVYK